MITAVLTRTSAVVAVLTLVYSAVYGWPFGGHRATAILSVAEKDNPDTINTLEAVVKGRAAGRAALRAAGAAGDERSVEALLASVAIGPTADDKLIQLSVKWGDPAVAVAIVNSLAGHYVEFSLAASRSTREAALVRAVEARKVAEVNLRRVESDLLTVTHNLPVASIVGAERAKLAEELGGVTEQKERLEAAVRQIDAAVMPLNAAPVAGDPVIQELNVQLIRARERRIALAAQHGTRDARVLAADVAMTRLHAEIESTAPRVARAFRADLAEAMRMEADVMARAIANRAQAVRLGEGQESARTLDERVSAHRGVVAEAKARELAARERLARAESAAQLVQPAAVPVEPPVQYASAAFVAVAGMAVVLTTAAAQIRRSVRAGVERRRVTRRQLATADPALNPLRRPSSVPVARRPSSSGARRST